MQYDQLDESSRELTLDYGQCPRSGDTLLCYLDGVHTTKNVAHHACWIPIPDRSEPIWGSILSWTGCYVRRSLVNLDLAAGSLIRCSGGHSYPQELKKGH